jgi:hypothetical protein
MVGVGVGRGGGAPVAVGGGGLGAAGGGLGAVGGTAVLVAVTAAVAVRAGGGWAQAANSAPHDTTRNQIELTVNFIIHPL